MKTFDENYKKNIKKILLTVPGTSIQKKMGIGQHLEKWENIKILGFFLNFIIIKKHLI